MSLYYVHFRDGAETLRDAEGSELADLAAVKAYTLLAARDTLSHEIRSGQIDLRPRLEVEDENGAVVYSLSLSDAVDIITS